MGHRSNQVSPGTKYNYMVIINTRGLITSDKTRPRFFITLSRTQDKGNWVGWGGGGGRGQYKAY